LAESCLERGNPNALSDAGVSAALFRAGAEGAAMNVLINLAGITDQTYVRETAAKARAILDEVRRESDAVVAKVNERLNRDALEG
jgi:formiminotetrahydrofolate cyclodeaminase